MSNDRTLGCLGRRTSPRWNINYMSSETADAFNNIARAD